MNTLTQGFFKTLWESSFGDFSVLLFCIFILIKWSVSSVIDDDNIFSPRTWLATRSASDLILNSKQVDLKIPHVNNE